MCNLNGLKLSGLLWTPRAAAVESVPEVRVECPETIVWVECPGPIMVTVEALPLTRDKRRFRLSQAAPRVDPAVWDPPWHTKFNTWDSSRSISDSSDYSQRASYYILTGGRHWFHCFYYDSGLESCGRPASSSVGARCCRPHSRRRQI